MGVIYVTGIVQEKLEPVNISLLIILADYSLKF